MTIARLAAIAVSRVESRHQFAKSLVGDCRTDAAALDFALIRSALWALTRGDHPPHVLRLVNLLVHLAMSHDAETDERTLRSRFHRQLGELADAGDIVELPNGRWYPAPVREISFGGVEREHLLVGGLPTGALPGNLQRSVTQTGAFRRVRTSDLREALALPIESLDSWLGAPFLPLIEWGQRILNSTLENYLEPNSSSSLRIYSPKDASSGEPQRRRWRERFDSMHGRFLAEKKRVFEMREYRVVELQRGRVQKSGAILLPGEARRLMYAADSIASNPTRVSVETLRDVVALSLNSELPRPELRLFAALGSLHVHPERYYPRVWNIAQADREVALQRLRDLDISISQRSRR